MLRTSAEQKYNLIIETGKGKGTANQSPIIYSVKGNRKPRPIDDQSYGLIIGEWQVSIRNMLGIELPEPQAYYSDHKIMLRAIAKMYDPSVGLDQKANVV